MACQKTICEVYQGFAENRAQLIAWGTAYYLDEDELADEFNYQQVSMVLRLQAEGNTLFPTNNIEHAAAVYLTSSDSVVLSEDRYLLDSGANVHCVISEQGMRNLKQGKGNVIVGDSRKVQSGKVGDLPLVTETGSIVLLQDMKVFPNFHRDIVSLPILLAKGCKITYVNHSKIIIKGPKHLQMEFRQDSDNLYYMSAQKLEVQNIVAVNVEEKGELKEIPIDTNVAHVLLNHPGELL